LRILATSREPLSIPGEVTWRVPELNEADAVALFAERARQARPGTVLPAGQAAVMRKICRRLDGLPLAVELAAAPGPDTIASPDRHHARAAPRPARRSIGRAIASSHAPRLI
jgi:hypothetical protein